VNAATEQNLGGGYGAFNFAAYDPAYSNYNYQFNYGYVTGGLEDHYVIEAMVPVSFFGGAPWGMDYTFHWTMECGNDNVNFGGSTPVPEPATLLLIGTGFLAASAFRRRRENARRGMKRDD